MPDEKKYDVGVIVGRFQLDELHEAHRALFDHVTSEHDKVVVYLGVSPLWGTRENTLDFEARKQMLLKAYPRLNVLYIKDVGDDHIWSNQLDKFVADVTTPTQTAVLYGGRDSFIARYHGKLPTREFKQEVWVSATAARANIRRNSAKANPAFRAGAIWAASARYPQPVPTVDVAILNEAGTEVLLGKKPNEQKYRFIGGFATPESDSYEQDARREVTEEVGIEVGDLTYVGSFKIDDWRYRSEVDKIKTTFYVTKYVYGQVRPMDDISEARWFPMAALHNEASPITVETHDVLRHALLKHLGPVIGDQHE